MVLELTRMAYQAKNFNCLEDVAIASFNEISDWGFNYNFECSYKGVVIYMDWDDYQTCHFDKDKIVAFIKSKYSDSVGESL